MEELKDKNALFDDKLEEQDKLLENSLQESKAKPNSLRSAYEKLLKRKIPAEEKKQEDENLILSSKEKNLQSVGEDLLVDKNEETEYKEKIESVQEFPMIEDSIIDTPDDVHKVSSIYDMLPTVKQLDVSNSAQLPHYNEDKTSQNEVALTDDTEIFKQFNEENKDDSKFYDFSKDQRMIDFQDIDNAYVSDIDDKKKAFFSGFDNLDIEIEKLKSSNVLDTTSEVAQDGLEFEDDLTKEIKDKEIFEIKTAEFEHDILRTDTKDKTSLYGDIITEAEHAGIFTAQTNEAENNDILSEDITDGISQHDVAEVEKDMAITEIKSDQSKNYDIFDNVAAKQEENIQEDIANKTEDVGTSILEDDKRDEDGILSKDIASNISKSDFTEEREDIEAFKTTNEDKVDYDDILSVDTEDYDDLDNKNESIENEETDAYTTSIDKDFYSLDNDDFLLSDFNTKDDSKNNTFLDSITFDDNIKDENNLFNINFDDMDEDPFWDDIINNETIRNIDIPDDLKEFEELDVIDDYEENDDDTDEDSEFNIPLQEDINSDREDNLIDSESKKIKEIEETETVANSLQSSEKLQDEVSQKVEDEESIAKDKEESFDNLSEIDSNDIEIEFDKLETNEASNKAKSKSNALDVLVKEKQGKKNKKVTAGSFDERFKSKVDELKNIYMELYSNKSMFDELCENIRNLYNDRSYALKQLDVDREKNPSWYKSNKMVGMSAYVDLFANNIKGLNKKLDYISNLGVNCLHLMPIYEATHEDDKDSAITSFSIDKGLGTYEDFVKLSKSLRKNKISLCLDFPLSHTSDDFEWATRAKHGDIEAQDRYYFFDNYAIPSKYDSTMAPKTANVPPGNFIYCEPVNRFIMATSHKNQWDLNYHNPCVFNDIACKLIELANEGVEIFNLSGIPYLWKEIGTTCHNLPQVHSILRMIRILVEIVCPAVVLNGQVNMMHDEIVSYFGTDEKPECHLMNNVMVSINLWNTIATSDARILKKNIKQMSELPENNKFLNYVRNYNDIAWWFKTEELAECGFDYHMHRQFLQKFFSGEFTASFAKGKMCNYDSYTGEANICGTTASLCGIEKAIENKDDNQLQLAIKRDVLLHAFIMSIPGIPVINSGDEIATTNDYKYTQKQKAYTNLQSIHRCKFDWKKVENLNRPSLTECKLYRGIKKVEKIRKSNRLFYSDASITPYEVKDHSVVAFIRSFEKRQVLCLFNFSAKDKTISTKMDIGRDLSNKKDENLAKINLSSYEYKFFELRF